MGVVSQEDTTVPARANPKVTTNLLRNVHPTWKQNGTITSQLFQPTLTNPRPSVYDGDKIEAECCWYHFTGNFGKSSIGVMAVTVVECNDLGVIVIPDPQEFPEHILMEIEAPTRNEKTTLLKKLRDFACSRGWLFKP